MVGAGEALRRREVSVLLRDQLRTEREMAKSARAHLQVAISHVLLELQWRRGWRCSAQFFKERRAMRLRYTALHQRALRSKLSADDAQEREMMERSQLSAAEIFYFRLLAETAAASPHDASMSAESPGPLRRRGLARFRRRWRASTSADGMYPAASGVDMSLVGEDDGSASGADQSAESAMPVLTDEQQRVMVALVKDDDEADMLSATGGDLAAESAVEHSLQLTIGRVSATLCAQTRAAPSSCAELLKLTAASLQAVAGFREGRARATGSLGALDVVSCGAANGTLAHALVRLRGATTGAGADAAVQFEWSLNREDEAHLRVRVPAMPQVVFAPLLLSRLGSFFASISDVHEALLLLRLRTYMRRVMWRHAKRDDLLSEVVAKHAPLHLTLEVDGARLLCSRDLADRAVPCLVCEVGAIRLTTVVPDATSRASPERVAAAAAASLAPGATAPPDLAMVNAACYSRIRVHLSALHVRLQLRSALTSDTLLAASPCVRYIASCPAGIDIDVDSCILPPGSHSFAQTRVDISAQVDSACNPETLAALSERHQQAGHVWQQAQLAAASVDRLQPVAEGSHGAEWWQPEWWQPRLMAVIPALPSGLSALGLGGRGGRGTPASDGSGRASDADAGTVGRGGVSSHGGAVAARSLPALERRSSGRDHKSAAQLASARAAGFTSGLHEALLMMRGEALVVRLSKQDADEIVHIIEAATEQTTTVRRTFLFDTTSQAVSLAPETPAPLPWHTWSPPPSAELVEALAVFDAARGGAAKEAAANARSETRVRLPTLSLILANQARHDATDEEVARLDASQVSVAFDAVGKRTKLAVKLHEASVNDCGAATDVPTRPSPLIRGKNAQLEVEIADNSALPRITWTLPDIQVGWMRGAAVRVLSWSLPTALVTAITSTPELHSISVALGSLTVTMHEPNGIPRFTITATDGRVLVDVDAGAAASGHLGALSIQELGSTSSEELFETRHQSHQRLVAFDLRVVGTSQRQRPPLGMLTGSGRGSKRQAYKRTFWLRVQPFLLHGRAASVMVLHAYLFDELGYLSEAIDQIGLRSTLAVANATSDDGALHAGMSARSDAGASTGDGPLEFDIDVVGASLRLLLDDSDSGLQLTFGRVVVDRSSQQMAVSRPSADARSSDTGGAMHEDHFTQPAAPDPLTVRVDMLELVTLRTGAGVGGVQSTPILREESLAFTLLGTEPAMHLRACGNELICDCSESQLQLLHTLARQATGVVPPRPTDDAAQETRPARAPSIRLNIGYRLARLSLSSTRGRLLANELYDLEVECRLGPLGNWLSIAVGAWQTQTARRTPQGGRANAALLAQASAESQPHPQLQFEQHIASASSAHAKDTYVLRFRPRTCHMARSAAQLSLARGWCGACARLWSLWLPLARFAAMLCCCLPAFRRLVLALLGEVCVRVCAKVCPTCGAGAQRSSTARVSEVSIHAADIEAGEARDL